MLGNISEFTSLFVKVYLNKKVGRILLIWKSHIKDDLCFLKESIYYIYLFFAEIKSDYPVFLASRSLNSSRAPVIFDTTHSVYHRGYSKSTGVFTADRNGIYIFLFRLEAKHELVRTNLRVNGVEKLEIRPDGRYSYFDDASAVTVLELSLNDQVSIGIKNGTVDDTGSLFFGVLLVET